MFDTVEQGFSDANSAANSAADSFAIGVTPEFLKKTSHWWVGKENLFHLTW
ncbi:TPA: hypothetical protein ACSP7Z_005116 [Serratia fonticola]